ncbi:hypothetical protein HMPREF3198_00606 [Winkia neuii]|nr:hypothetical protein HMPREF3198_00606 [Winkia neuii]
MSTNAKILLGLRLVVFSAMVIVGIARICIHGSSWNSWILIVAGALLLIGALLEMALISNKQGKRSREKHSV